MRAFTYENMPWREAQQAGMLWAPLRKPHENALDPHWIKRGSVTDVEHPGARQVVPLCDVEVDRHGHRLDGRAARAAPRRGRRRRRSPDDRAARRRSTRRPRRRAPARLSPRGKPFALDGIRVLDFTWFLASAGGTRFLRSFGAECIKVELEEPSRHAARRHGADRRPRGAR